MGRPRKYPRTELCGHTNASTTGLPSNPATPLFERGCNRPTLFMRTFPADPYEDGGHNHPSIHFSQAPVPWRTLSEETITNSQFNASAATSIPSRHRPVMSDHEPPSASQNQQTLLRDQHGNKNIGPHAQQTFPVLEGATPLGAPINMHHVPIGRDRLTGTLEAIEAHSILSSQRISSGPSPNDVQTIDPASGNALIRNHCRSSVPDFLPSSTDFLVNIHQTVASCDVTATFQQFKGRNLHAMTQAHLQFILQEYPNTCILASPRKHPSVMEPALYFTMVADVVSLITCSQASAPDPHEGCSTIREPLFIEMLNCDRGENSFQATWDVNQRGFTPMEQLSREDLNLVCSKWLHANPFGFLFSETMDCKDRALLAAVVGWHFYLSSRRGSSYKSDRGLDDGLERLVHRSHMPFFEYAEMELMSRTTVIDGSTVSTVQGLILLATFRSADCQPRCGWALLSVAHILSKEYLSSIGGAGCPRGSNAAEFDRQRHKMMGLYWLLSLYRTWSQLSMSFSKATVHLMLDGSLPYLKAYLTHAGAILRSGESQRNNEWANRLLLDASQILEVFCTLSTEDPSSLLMTDPTGRLPCYDRLTESNIYLVRWLLETAKMRCKTVGWHQSPRSYPIRETSSNSREIPNSHANIVLAVVFSIFALSRLIPFEDMMPGSFSRIPVPILGDVLKSLQMISAEGISPVVASCAVLDSPDRLGLGATCEALLLRLLRGIFPYMLILLQSIANTLPDFSNVRASDYTSVVSQLLEVIETLESFAAARVSLYPLEDCQLVENLRTKVGSLQVTLPPCSLPMSTQIQRENMEKHPSLVSAEARRNASEITHTTPVDSSNFFETNDESMSIKTNPIPINEYPLESTSLLTSHAASTVASSAESTLTCNNLANPSYFIASTAMTGPSSPLIPPEHSQVSTHCFHAKDRREAKTEPAVLPSLYPDVILPVSNAQEMIIANELNQTELNSTVFRCSREVDDQNFSPLDSSWIPHTLRLPEWNSHSQQSSFDGFPRPRIAASQGSHLESPPSYQQYPNGVEYFSNNLELQRECLGNFALVDPDPNRRRSRPSDLGEQGVCLNLGVTGALVDTPASSVYI